MPHVEIKACPICPVRRGVAARVAEESNRMPGVHATITNGGLGELSVAVDGRRVFRSRGVLVSPSARRVLRHVEGALSVPAAVGRA